MKKNFILAAAFIAFFACKQEQPKEQTEAVTSDTVTTEKEHQHDEHEAIVLDNGKKWKVVESMAVYIRNMEKAVIEFESSNPKDYSVLAKVIDKNIEDLTSNCTMTGQAHDELHKWLVPFIELSEKFDAATELSVQEQIYLEFKATFKTYNTYFE